MRRSGALYTPRSAEQLAVRTVSQPSGAVGFSGCKHCFEASQETSKAGVVRQGRGRYTPPSAGSARGPDGVKAERQGPSFRASNPAFGAFERKSQSGLKGWEAADTSRPSPETPPTRPTEMSGIFRLLFEGWIGRNPASNRLGHGLTRVSPPGPMTRFLSLPDRWFGAAQKLKQSIDTEHRGD